LTLAIATGRGDAVSPLPLIPSPTHQLRFVTTSNTPSAHNHLLDDRYTGELGGEGLAPGDEEKEMEEGVGGGRR